MGLSFLASHAEAADEAEAPSHRHSGEGVFQTRRLLPTGFRKREEDEGGEQRGDMAASSRSSCAFRMAAPPRPHGLAFRMAAAAPRGGPGAGRRTPPAGSWGLAVQPTGVWGHLLATAESWSRMRPRPSSIVSSVSLLSSTVTAEMEGLSPHRLGSSWIWKENRVRRSEPPWTWEPSPIPMNLGTRALCSGSRVPALASSSN